MTQQKTARLIAVETLHQLTLSPVPLPILFQKTSADQGLSGSDRGLAMNLIFGVLRQKQYLDFLILRLCRCPLKKLHPLVHQALAVGLYQLFFLSRIPDSAAVNETVKAVKNTKIPKRLYGFVNGVLRASIRQRQNLPQPGDPDENDQPILNHPEWLTTRWQQHFGRTEMLAICEQNNIQRPLSLRVNSVNVTREEFLFQLATKGIEAEPGKYAPDAVLLRNYHGQIAAIPGYEAGHFQVQDEAAQLASLLLQPFKAEGHYLDGCSGLGGKTGHLLQLIDGLNATLTAVEPEANRQDKLVLNLHQLFPQKKYCLFHGNLQQFCNQTSQRFDGVLIDAPCSGTGVTGRHPDIRWNRTPEDIYSYTQTQQDLITHAASMVLPKGILVYATCSLEPEENEEVVSQFLQNNSQFTVTDCTPFLPSEAAPLIRNGFFQPRPTDSLDGFFAARLLRNNCDD